MFAAGGGLTYTYLLFKLEGTVPPTSVGDELKENFYAQELPIPLLSLRAEYPLAPRLRALATVDGGFLPRVDSLRTEGGTVYLKQAHADVFLGLRYSITDSLLADGGYSYTHFSQEETSHEDDNKIVLDGHALRLGLTYRF